jgi:hypothetical protein
VNGEVVPCEQLRVFTASSQPVFTASSQWVFVRAAARGGEWAPREIEIEIEWSPREAALSWAPREAAGAAAGCGRAGEAATISTRSRSRAGEVPAFALTRRLARAETELHSRDRDRAEIELLSQWALSWALFSDGGESGCGEWGCGESGCGEGGDGAAATGSAALSGEGRAPLGALACSA